MRNKTFVAIVMERDLGICVACGMKGSEVHHINPLVFGGKDEMNKQRVIEYKTQLAEMGVEIPDNKKLYEIGIFNGEGAY